MGRVLEGVLRDQRLLRRYAKHLRPGAASLDHLAQTIHALLHAGGTGDPFFLSKSLELLVNRLGASQAALVMVTGATLEIRWWHPELPGEQAPHPIPSFCAWLLEHPERTLVIRDMAVGPHVSHLVEGHPVSHKAALGCALRKDDSVRALLFAYFDQPRSFPRAQFALLEAVAGFMGRVLEIEELKQSLNRLEDALAITQAVMEDSSTLDPETELPNLRYLEIWQKAMLSSEHRPDNLVVAEFQVAVKGRKDVARLHKATEGVRAGDLVVRVAPGRFLIIFQHTPRSIAHVLLLRLRTQLNGAPMGATLWVPGSEGLPLESCQSRLDAALAESRAMSQPALVWHLPEGFAVEPPLQKPPPVAPPPGPQRWEPPVLWKT
jgi:GGDEF domain-containing protein